MSEYSSALTRREFVTRSALLGGGLLLGGGALAACSGSTAGARTGSAGTINLGVTVDVDTFNPDNLLFNNFIYTRTMYDTLIDYSTDLKAVMRMAQKIDVSPDHTSITAVLRKGILFQSGAQVDADAVVKNFQFSSDPNRGHQVASLLAKVKSVTAVDPDTVKFAFKSPIPQLAATDVLQAMPIIDPKYLGNDESALKGRGGGSGPFAFGEWRPGSTLSLQKFDNYYMRPLPHLDKVNYQIFQSGPSAAAALRSGTIDVAAYLEPNLVKPLAADFNVLKGTEGTLTYCFEFNATRAPFTSKAVRQAFQYAVNREGFVQNVLFGFSAPTALPWGPGSPAYDANALSKYPFDLNKAKRLLTDAGVTPGTKFNIAVNSSYPFGSAMAQILQADLRKIGYDLNIIVKESATWVSDYFKGNFDMVPNFSGNTAKYPTECVQNSFYRPQQNSSFGPGPTPASWTNALNDADAALTIDTQRAAFDAMNKALLDESWLINVAYNVSLVAMSKKVSNFALNLDDMIRIENAQIG